MVRKAARMIINNRITVEEDSSFTNDLMSNLMSANMNANFSMEQFEDMIAFFVFCSSCLVGTFFYFIIVSLALFPDYQTKVRQEIVGLQAELLPDDDLYKKYDLIKGKLDYTVSFLKEVLRVFPPLVEPFFRMANQDVRIQDESASYFIPKGTLIRIPIYSVHMNPQIWSNPSVFNPDRTRHQFYPKLAFMPFGQGSLGCMGETFAMHLAKIFIVELVPKLQVNLHPDAELVLQSKFTLDTAKPIHVIFSPVKHKVT